MNTVVVQLLRSPAVLVMRGLIGLAAALTGAEPATATPWAGTTVVYQYATTIAVPAKEVPGTAAGKSQTVNAYLWVPPQAERIRGLLIGGTVLFEGAFAAHPHIRAACAEADLAILLFSPHVDAVFANPATPGIIKEVLDTLAKASNHAELATAPWLPYGHSVGTLWTKNVLFTYPERCFGGLFFKGGFAVAEGKQLADIAGIPLLHVQGRFEEFGPGPSGVLRPKEGEDRSTGGKTAMSQLSAFRASEPRFLMSLLVEDGATHFPLSDRVAIPLAAYITAAARARIPAQAGPLITLDPASGALSRSGNLFAPASTPAAPWATYTGNKAETFWHLTPDLATQADAFHAVAVGKTAQFVSFDNGKGSPLAVGDDMRMKLRPTWTAADTFTIKGIFCSTLPKNYPPVDGAISHAAGEPLLRIFSGPLEQIGANTFRITMDVRGGNRPFILAYHPGDATYRYCEQPGLIANAKAEGPEQTIAFSAPAIVAMSSLPLQLTATSSSGLPVRFHVNYGPAVITDNQLSLRDVPDHAQWPLQIELVAWQWGSAIAPKFSSAPVVKQLITVTR